MGLVEAQMEQGKILQGSKHQKGGKPNHVWRMK
jgi:hypothetical protein